MFAVALLAMADAARAQVGVSASFDTDYRFRGFSLSNNRPTASLAFSFDHASGAYAGASVIATETPQARLGFLGYVTDLGYARHIDGQTSWDVGATYTDINTNTLPNYRLSYTEIYTGVSHNNFKLYLYYSPNYLHQGVDTLYVDASATFRPASRWRLFGHVGVQTPLGGREDSENGHEQYDVRAGAAYEIGKAEFQLAWTSIAPYAYYPIGNRQERSAVVFEITYVF